MQFSEPQKNVEHLYLREGVHVADLGAGTGAYVVAAAKKVGERGKVYAVEVQKDLLANIKSAARAADVEDRVEFIWGDIEEQGGSKIADAMLDAVIISNVLFQTEDKEGLMKEANRILKRGGKMLVVEWADSFGGLGPEIDAVVGKSEAKKICMNTGFELEKEFDAGEHHYGFVCIKK